MGNLQILLRQHVGAPCEAIVKAGDRVEKGTLIATPTGLGANIFNFYISKKPSTLCSLIYCYRFFLYIRPLFLLVFFLTLFWRRHVGIEPTRDALNAPHWF